MKKLIDIINTDNEPDIIDNMMKATEIINWRKVSTALSGNPEGVRSTYSGKKYKEQVDELVEFAESWLERHSKDQEKHVVQHKK
jgi:hypothetical protein